MLTKLDFPYSSGIKRIQILSEHIKEQIKSELKYKTFNYIRDPVNLGIYNVTTRGVEYQMLMDIHGIYI